jgi:predicted TIM-barrel fold metal-dependent hydrolase
MTKEAQGPPGGRRLTRRAFMRASAAMAAASAAAPLLALPPAAADIVDCHTHFYDPTRPEGVPWPARTDTELYRPGYPQDYRAVSAPYGISATVVIEASAWLEDNAWVLGLADREPLIAGFVGRLAPGDPAFAAGVRRFGRNPLFRGIRVSGDEVGALTGTGKLRDLALLADHDLSLDVNGTAASLPAVAAIARAVPSLRIVIDHVANVAIDGRTPPAGWLDGMHAASRQPNVFCKVSGLVEGSGRRGGAAPAEVDFYRPVLDAVWERFGSERVIYGSNWPVSALFAPFGTVHQIVAAYVAARGGRAARQYFSENGRRAYKWVKRGG